MGLPRALEPHLPTPPKPVTPPPPPPPPPPVFEPGRRWRLSSYLACVPPKHPGALTLDEVREIVPWRWAKSPRTRLRLAGIGYSTLHPRLRGDSAIWVRRAEPAEVQLGEVVREAIQAGPQKATGSSHSTSWHLPPEPSGSGVLRRWRLALPGDGPEVQRMIRGIPHAPGDELQLQCGTSPEEVSRLVRAWVKGWAPTG